MDEHLAVFAVKGEAHECAIGETQVVRLVWHRIGLAAMTQLVQKAVAAGHQWLGCRVSLLHRLSIEIGIKYG